MRFKLLIKTRGKKENVQDEAKGKGGIFYDPAEKVSAVLYNVYTRIPHETFQGTATIFPLFPQTLLFIQIKTERVMPFLIIKNVRYSQAHSSA